MQFHQGMGKKRPASRESILHTSSASQVQYEKYKLLADQPMSGIDISSLALILSFYVDTYPPPSRYMFHFKTPAWI